MKHHIRPAGRLLQDVAFLIVILFGIFFGQKAAIAQNPKLDEIKSLIAKNYADSIGDSAMTIAAIRGITHSLDPFSAYLSPEAYRGFQDRMDPGTESVFGIGVRLFAERDTARIFTVLAGSPAERIGMLPGDRIIRIGKENTIGMSKEDVERMLSTPTFENKVEVTVFRPNDERIIRFDVAPQDIAARKAVFTTMLNDTSGYIRFDGFTKGIAEAVESEIKSLQHQGMRCLVLDLRGNGGGRVEEATDLAREFIGDRSKLLTLYGRNDRKETYFADQNAEFDKLPLLVLVDEWTASASELFTGIMQDLDRALLVGTQTYGKSLVQQIYDLPNGGGLKLTTSRAYLPSGRFLQRRYEGTRFLDARLSLDTVADNYEHGLEASSVSKKYRPFLTFYGRKVYGGQGIIPDYLLEQHPMQASTEQIFDAEIFSALAIQYLPEHAAKLKSAYSANNFISEFHGYDNLLSDIQATAKRWKIPVDQAELMIDRGRIEKQFAIQVAYQLFGDDAWRQPDLKRDKGIHVALLHQADAEKLLELAAK